MGDALLTLRDIERHYPEGDHVVRALDGVDLELEAGEIVILQGPSGSGKTTLLNVISALDMPTSGEYMFLDQTVPRADEEVESRTFENPASDALGVITAPMIWLVNGMWGLATAPKRFLDNRGRSKALEEMTTFRRENISYIFQFFNLLDDLTVMENVLLAQEIHGSRDINRVMELLELVGLQGLEQRFPSEISGGQQQRVAIARSLAKAPKLLLGDEPTGNLDSTTTDRVMRVLVDACRREGITAIIVTHDSSLTRFATRVLTIDSGRIVEDKQGEMATATGRAMHAAEGVAISASEAISGVAGEIGSAAREVAAKVRESAGGQAVSSVGDSVNRIGATAARAGASVASEAAHRAADVASGVGGVVSAAIAKVSADSTEDVVAGQDDESDGTDSEKDKDDSGTDSN